MVVEHDGLPGLDEVVELIGGPARELVDDGARLRRAEEVEPVEQPAEGVHQADVGLEALADVRALNLHCDRFARVQDGPMDLADGGGRERSGLEGPEDLLRRAAELALHDLPDLVVRERADRVQQLEQLVAVGRRQQVEPHGQHLAELDPGPAELLEREPHPGGPERRAGRAHP